MLVSCHFTSDIKFPRISCNHCSDRDQVNYEKLFWGSVQREHDLKTAVVEHDLESELKDQESKKAKIDDIIKRPQLWSRISQSDQHHLRNMGFHGGWPHALGRRPDGEAPDAPEVPDQPVAPGPIDGGAGAGVAPDPNAPDGHGRVY